MGDNRTMNDKCEIYDVIVIGAGASGLFYAAGSSLSDRASVYSVSSQTHGCGTPDASSAGTCAAPGSEFRGLILEKISHVGQKLLMSGNGMCNITHGGSIKTFVDKYGENGRLIRGCLYKHNNLELIDMMERLGVHLVEREDGKIFPGSMKAKDVLDALLRAARLGGWQIRCDSEVTALRPAPVGESAPSGPAPVGAPDGAPDDTVLVNVVLRGGTVLRTRKVVAACGGSSYPSTGSDGTFLDVLERDLGVSVKEPRPALTPIFVQDYRFGEISGVSLQDVQLTCGRHETRGAMLFTHKGISGPAVLHMSQYVNTGDTLMISFLPDAGKDEVVRRLKADAPGNRIGLANYISSTFSLPKSFIELLLDRPERRLSTLSGSDLEQTAEALTLSCFSVSGTGGWNDAMVTSGGVALDSVDLRTMRIKKAGSTFPALPDIRIIGEVLDVNGDTGGYNLQFAYSSAMAARTPN